jgi:hypothetical protein
MKAKEANEAIEENDLLPRFASNLFSVQFMNLPAIKNLQASDAGRKFISITEIKAEELLPSGETFDALKKDAEGFLDKIQKDSKGASYDD